VAAAEGDVGDRHGRRRVARARGVESEESVVAAADAQGGAADRMRTGDEEVRVERTLE